MAKAIGYAARAADKPLSYFEFERREPKADDVEIEIAYCGVCHSDLHQARDEWGGTVFPCLPGHEIVGTVTRVGNDVTKYKVGDKVGVGCMVDSCGTCISCEQGHEQYCENGFVATYNGEDKHLGGATYGGYSNRVVVREDFVLKIADDQDLAAVSPLLCAGITTYSPLHHWGVTKGHKVGVVGLGGLGHMAVKIAKAMGAEVVLFTTSPGKVDDAKRLGADHVVISKDEEQMKAWRNRLDFILNTVAAPHDLDAYMELLRLDGTMTLVGVPASPHPSPSVANLIFKRRSLAGSLIGGIRETQEMLDFCAKHNITSDIEMIDIDEINDAYERMLKSDVKYRFVIDMKSLKQQ